MFGYNNVELIKQNGCCLDSFDQNFFECIITKMDIVECICRPILNADILFNLNK